MIELTLYAWMGFWAWMLIPVAAARYWFDRFDPLHTRAGWCARWCLKLIGVGAIGLLELDALSWII